ncbi:bifunctional 2-keto-4-hydroxyglutarate aldolase/2-keto-3-deoxy-6-phosphogluconate aldolase [Candidatus Enterococcus ikei]|uniref:Bifunctional 2-keto-4-hydroxyglutarate aldolase/2-keto-3-deoxy-6-phosphogluconate aldolase n=1 Tax=Candidatus Enterococcus ikei TaxID=2815326 RepID=A0ABS3H4V3_9ENTE|nr:bifunctional 2-keto-4-hydroxyglutarate aldolase/2-keto-3-deoxy-6-phosphogluconate aldolase [Enterococcus sp. DIV0869a]MBO0441729.1 bifunctional 2-keto-4-hydroxyglutarate aldolase/2-keto-3-deoxy-6-phosphogluconate aldolase [Enterococcus sp. DIV0869a]
MFRTTILNRMEETAIMAIVRVDTMERAIEIVDGCLAGGVDCLEISYTLPNAGEIIRQLTQQYGEQVLIGAGTVLDSETARLAILAGAKFIIAPNFDPSVCKLCNRYQIPYMPGCTSVTEMITAIEAGAAMVKAFPISSFYGPTLITTLKTPTPYLPIMSSGGANLENIDEWLKSGVDCVGIGSLLTKGTKEEIAANAKQLKQAVINHRTQAN